MKFRIIYHEELTSTNSLASKFAAAGEPEGLVIVADYQTHGRGKLDRKWVSPRGKNLLFSLLIRPMIKPSEAPMLTQIACRSVAKTLAAHYGILTTFKRPNDVMVNGKKICGILVEASTRSKDHLESAVIGIGLNVNSLAGELTPEATSIRELKGHDYCRDTLLKHLLVQLKKDLSDFKGWHLK